MQHLHSITKAAKEAFAATLTLSLAGYASFLAAEPWGQNAVAQSASDEFIVTQVITAEVSFQVPATDVTLTLSIGGLTGGDSSGSTQFAVATNAATGYTVTIEAQNDPAMQANTTSGEIEDYESAVAGVPDFDFITAGTYGRLAYTVSASTTGDLAQKFLDDGDDCNVGDQDTNGSDSCWYGLSTTATSTIVRTSSTSSAGEFATLFFRVHVPQDPVPALPADTYTATTTLTATVNP